MKFNQLVLTLAAGALLLTATSGYAAAASQNWYLGDELTLIANRTNVPTPDPESEAAVVSVTSNNPVHWDANEPAAIDIDFTSGQFTYSLKVRTTLDFGAYCVAIGSYDGATFTQNNAPNTGCGTMAANCVGGICMGSVPVTNFVVLEGDKLSVLITNTPDNANAMKIFHSDADSFFTSTPADPGYPTPELGTILLMGAGLGVVAMVVVSRRRA